LPSWGTYIGTNLYPSWSPEAKIDGAERTNPFSAKIVPLFLFAPNSGAKICSIEKKTLFVVFVPFFGLLLKFFRLVAFLLFPLL
jgi:hypothetical protein